VVERVSDKDEVDGPIPSTRTNFLMLHTIRHHVSKVPAKTLWRIFFYLVLLGIVVAGSSALLAYFFRFVGQPLVTEILRHQQQLILIYFFYIVLSTIVFPIPSLPLDILLLTTLNPILVLLVRLLGDIVGSALAFSIARRYGRPALKRFFQPKVYHQIEKVSENVSLKQFFWISMFPLINTEIMAYAAGLSELGLLPTIGSLLIAVSYRLGLVYLFIQLR
jgi:uncharacterized membrane protein YdjX (TVP38/TMEM64 family)